MDEMELQEIQANDVRKKTWQARHNKIMAAIKKNPAASNKRIAAIVGCSRSTVEHHRNKQIEFEQQNHLEKHPRL
jgi:FixJ family two-component response regulator